MLFLDDHLTRIIYRESFHGDLCKCGAGAIESQEDEGGARAVGNVVAKGWLEVEEFAEAAGLGAANGDFGLFLVIHAQLVGTLEPGDYFADVVDVD
jgi:hypothetical protein